MTDTALRNELYDYIAANLEGTVCTLGPDSNIPFIDDLREALTNPTLQTLPYASKELKPIEGTDVLEVEWGLVVRRTEPHNSFYIFDGIPHFAIFYADGDVFVNAQFGNGEAADQMKYIEDFVTLLLKTGNQIIAVPTPI